MPMVEHSVLVPFSKGEIYHIVSDLPSYSQFLPKCVRCDRLPSIYSANRFECIFKYMGIKIPYWVISYQQRPKLFIERWMHHGWGTFILCWHFETVDTDQTKIRLVCMTKSAWWKPNILARFWMHRRVKSFLKIMTVRALSLLEPISL